MLSMVDGKVSVVYGTGCVKSSLSLLVWGNFFLFIGLALAVILFGWFFGSKGGSFFIEWEFFNSCGVCLTALVLVDMLSVMFFCLVSVISGCVFLFSVSYMCEDKFVSVFCYLTVWFVVAMGILIFVPHLVFLLVGWDLLGVISFLLILHYQNKSCVGAGMLTVMVNRVGDVFLLLSVGLGASFGGWEILGTECSSVSGFGLIGVFLAGASMTKSAQLPFSVWLPAAMAAPMPISALVHSSTLVTAGVYLMFRYYPLLSALDGVLVLLSKVGCLTFLMASLGACLESDVKKLIALSTLSHLGFMVYILGLGYPVLGVFHLFCHALFKSLLFMCAGYFVHNTVDSSQDIRQLCGIGWGSSSLLVSCAVIGFSSLCGVPYLGGFYSKHAILEGSVSVFGGAFEVLCLLVSAGASYCYSVRFLLEVVFGVYGGQCCLSGNGAVAMFPIVLLTIGSVVVGYMLEQIWVELCGVIGTGLVLKVVLLLVMSFGVIVAIVGKLYGWRYNMSGWGPLLGRFCTLSFVEVFLSSMWFFRWSPCFVAEPWFRGGVMVVSALEMGWMEVLGGCGVFSWFSLSSVKLWSLECAGFLVALRLGVILSLLLLVF